MGKYAIGDIVVRNPSESLTFHSGDEFTHLIFISNGSYMERILDDLDDDYGYHPKRKYKDIECPNVIEILNGYECNWGMHMFSSFGDFINYGVGLRCLIESNPILQQKIKYDIEDESKLYGFDELNGMRIYNAIVRHAQFLLSHEDIIFNAINKLDIEDFDHCASIRICVIEKLNKIASEPLFDIMSLTEIELEEEAKKKEEKQKEEQQTAEE